MATKAKADTVQYAKTVRARERGYYGQMHEKGEVFANTLNLATYPEDENSWIEDSKAPEPESDTDSEAS